MQRWRRLLQEMYQTIIAQLSVARGRGMISFPTTEAVMRLVAALAMIVFTLGMAAADPPPQPKGPPIADPPFVTDAWLKDGSLHVTREVTVLVKETRTEQRTGPDGKPFQVTVVVNVPVQKQVTAVLDPKFTEVQTREGKAIATADWGKVLKEKSKVIVSPDGKPVPDSFLKANKEVELVVLHKPAK
jgi:hypothetical protein